MQGEKGTRQTTKCGKTFAAYMIDKDMFPSFHTKIGIGIVHRKETKMADKLNTDFKTANQLNKEIPCWTYQVGNILKLY